MVPHIGIAPFSLLLFSSSILSALIPKINHTCLTPSTPANYQDFHCTVSKDWLDSQLAMNSQDCETASRTFYKNEVQHYGQEKFEFSTGPGALPRKYWTESCTFAIVMLDYFFPKDLPGIDPSAQYELKDTSSYWDIYVASQNVFHWCVGFLDGHAGWAPVGMLLSLSPEFV